MNIHVSKPDSDTTDHSCRDTLSCEGLHFSWQKVDAQVRTLDNVHLKVKLGEFISIIGPSGCGKSTLLNVIGGLKKPDRGRVMIGDKEIKKPIRQVGMVFQNYSLFPWLNVMDNVCFGLKMAGVTPAKRNEKAKMVLERVGLWDAHQKYPHELSGGMKQRVSIARALANDADVLLMDEPFAALDFDTRAKMQDFLLEVWREFQKTIIFVTHHVDESIALSDRIFLMSANPGRLSSEIVVDQPRPRSPVSSEFNHHRTRIIQHLAAEGERGS